MKGVLFLMICMVMTTCNTIEIPLEMDSKVKPVFEITGTLGTKSIDLAAGKDNFVLSTSFERLNFQVVQLSGVLRSKVCDASCKPSLKFNLRQNINELNNQGNRSIMTGRRSYYKLERDSLLLKSNNLSRFSNSTTAKIQYTWIVNDKKNSTDENIEIVNNGMDSKICLNLFHPDGSTASNCQILNFNPFDSLPGLKVNLESSANNKIQRLEAKVTGKGPFKFIWEGNSKSTDPFLEWDGKQTSQCVTVIDINGNMATDCVALNPEGKVKLKSQFLIEYNLGRILEIAQFNTVELFYIDTDGTVWATSARNQSSNSIFEILEDSQYELNEKSQPTRKLKIRMDGLMFNTKGESATLRLDGTIGVALPPK